MQQHPPSLQHSPHLIIWSQQPLAQLLQHSPHFLQSLQNGVYKQSSLTFLQSLSKQQQAKTITNGNANIEPIIRPAKAPEPCSHSKYNLALLLLVP